MSTLTDLICGGDPEAVAVHERTADGATVTVTRGELRRRVRGLVAELAARGLGRGEAVAVWLPNWSDALVWQAAVAACGAHVIGLNTRYGVEEATHVLARARPRIVAVAEGFHGLDLRARLDAAIAGSGVAPAVVPVAGPGAAAHGGPELTGGPDPDALVVAFTTSGSTGLPKLAAHTATGVVEHAHADAAALGLRPDDVVLGALPLSGVFGYNAVLAALAAGASVVLEPVFDAEAVLDDMARLGVTHVGAGDDMMLRLAQAWRAHPRDLSAWRWWGVADFQGRAAELAAWASDELGVTVTGVYGSSEIFALASTWPDDEPAPRRWTGGGRVVHPAMRVRVGDPQTGDEAPAGTEGELQFRGPNVVDTYLGPEQPDVWTPDGWFRSGDLGALVAEGVFVYVARLGDALRLRGFLVDPAEIEVRLAAHPAVDTAKVVGVAGADGATVAVGFVTLDAELADDLCAWCAETLAAFKVPAAVHVLDEMPTTSGTNGVKIRTAVLRERAARIVLG